MRLIKACAVLLIVLVLRSEASAQPHDYFVTFGDSLADNGNVFLATLQRNPPIPPPGAYCQGRFSSGPVAFEFVWAGLKQLPLGPACPVPIIPGGLKPALAPGFSPAINYAFGGSTTEEFTELPLGQGVIPGLIGQVKLFRQALGGQPPPPGTLYAIMAGANDYLSLPAIDPSQEEAVVEGIVGNIVEAIRALYRLGARNIIVVNLPDLGVAPIVGPNPARRALLSRLAAAHNLQLAKVLGKLETKLDGLNIVEIDLGPLLQQIPNLGFQTQVPALDLLLPPPPALGGLPMSFCLFVNPATCGVVPSFSAPLLSLFWDAEHPTTEAHFVLAQYILSRLAGN